MSKASAAASQEDPLAIARRILLSSPPGEFDLILADLRKVLPAGAAANEQFIAETRRLYGEQTGSRLSTGAGADSGERNVAGGEKCAKLRSKMDSYMTSNYCAPPSSGYAVSPAVGASANADSLTLEVYAEKVSVSNCHTGSWHATYTIQVLSSTSATIGGTVRLRSHEYEDMANVQLSSTHTLDQVTVSAGQEAGQDWADAVLSQIQIWERDDVQGYLANLYDGERMNDGMLRSMRRVLPVTRTRMDWNMGGHRLVKTLNDTKKK